MHLNNNKQTNQRSNCRTCIFPGTFTPRSRRGSPSSSSTPRTYVELASLTSPSFSVFVRAPNWRTTTNRPHNHTPQNQDAEYAKRKLDHEYLKGRELAVVFAKVSLSPPLFACCFLIALPSLGG